MKTVATFYRFVHLLDCGDFRDRLEAECRSQKVYGMITVSYTHLTLPTKA